MIRVDTHPYACGHMHIYMCVCAWKLTYVGEWLKGTIVPIFFGFSRDGGGKPTQGELHK